MMVVLLLICVGLAYSALTSNIDEGTSRLTLIWQFRHDVLFEHVFVMMFENAGLTRVLICSVFKRS